MENLMFLWSKGAATKVDLLEHVLSCNKQNEPCYIAILARKFSISHVAIKKHVDLMLVHGYLEVENPGRKPRYLRLTKKGHDVLGKFKLHQNQFAVRDKYECL